MYLFSLYLRKIITKVATIGIFCVLASCAFTLSIGASKRQFLQKFQTQKACINVITEICK